MTTPHGKQAFPSRAAVETSASAVQFQHMYQEHQRVIFRSIYSWVGNREDAEDLTADIFLKAVSGVDYERPPKMIRRWLFQVARTRIDQRIIRRMVRIIDGDQETTCHSQQVGVLLVSSIEQFSIPLIDMERTQPQWQGFADVLSGQ